MLKENSRFKEDKKKLVTTRSPCFENNTIGQLDTEQIHCANYILEVESVLCRFSHSSQNIRSSSSLIAIWVDRRVESIWNLELAMIVVLVLLSDPSLNNGWQGRAAVDPRENVGHRLRSPSLRVEDT